MTGDSKYNGSSLRAQGTPRIRRIRHYQRRFIPAGAGNTRGRNTSGDPRAVHPCGRREHVFISCLMTWERGSSLRAQGTPSESNEYLFHDRFIPAGAGNTALRGYQRLNKPVHPCGRREHLNMVKQKMAQTGSSLRAQGTPGHRSVQQLCRRFIPAGAGNTGQHLTPTKPGTVHPCGRREHNCVRSPPHSSTGSSLRAQGTPEVSPIAERVNRFIPAGAGNTVKNNIL